MNAPMIAQGPRMAQPAERGIAAAMIGSSRQKNLSAENDWRLFLTTKIVAIDAT